MALSESMHIVRQCLLRPCRQTLADRRHAVLPSSRSSFVPAHVVSCSYSTQPASVTSNLDVSVDDRTGIALLRLTKKPVNSLSLEFLTELNITLEKLENERSCNALIITSAFPKIFCAGLDILEMYQPKKERLSEFWRSFQNFYLRLYGSRLVTAAAINGHAVAGGCVVALSCDHRIMASGNYTIGLNETLLGIMAPFWVMNTMKNVLGHHKTERALQLGSLFNTEEALKIGLVDEVAAETEVVERARLEVTKWLKVPGYARQLTKEAMRKPTLDALLSRRTYASARTEMVNYYSM